MTDLASDLCAWLAQASFFQPAVGQTISACDAAASGAPFDDVGDRWDLLAKAARGDLQAQRHIADLATWDVLAGEPDALTTLHEGLMFARMAAFQGTLEDELRVLSMLSLATLLATGEQAIYLAAEAVARCEIIADVDGPEGENAASLLAGCAERESPEVLERAKAFRAAILKAKEID